MKCNNIIDVNLFKRNIQFIIQEIKFTFVFIKKLFTYSFIYSSIYLFLDFIDEEENKNI